MVPMPRAKKSTVKPTHPLSLALYQLRVKMDWDQEQAAKQIPVTRISWTRWEKDASKIDPITNFALRALIGMHAPELLKKLPK
jgi:DNA-binding XRE family transcriptional regulator